MTDKITPEMQDEARAIGAFAAFYDMDEKTADYYWSEKARRPEKERWLRSIAAVREADDALGAVSVPKEATEAMVVAACPDLEAMVNAQAATGDIPCAQVPTQIDMRRAGIRSALNAAIRAGAIGGEDE